MDTFSGMGSLRKRRGQQCRGQVARAGTPVKGAADTAVKRQRPQRRKAPDRCNVSRSIKGKRKLSQVMHPPTCTPPRMSSTCLWAPCSHSHPLTTMTVLLSSMCVMHKTQDKGAGRGPRWRKEGEAPLPRRREDCARLGARRLVWVSNNQVVLESCLKPAGRIATVKSSRE